MATILDSTGKIAFEIRSELDRIAAAVSRAYSELDQEPNPEKLDNLLNGPCRICRLLWDRGRSIAAFIERDPNLLDTDTTRGVLQSFLTDLENHKKTTAANSIKMYPNDLEKHQGHDPTVNYAKAMLEHVRKSK